MKYAESRAWNIGLSSLTLLLDLSSNTLSGSIPSEVGNLTNLQKLYVSTNKLSGRIPNTLGNCLNLEALFMENNSFEGELPQSLSTLKGMKWLDLSCNKLSGEIPRYLVSFPLLSYCNLSFNELEGSVPNDGIFSNSSAVSVSGNSKLCGGADELKLSPCPVIKRRESHVPIVVVPVTAITICLILLLCFFLVLHQRKRLKMKSLSPSQSNYQYPRISYVELVKATNCFSSSNLIGVGSYASVYKGIFDQATPIMAVKVLNLENQGGSTSFLSECNALRNLRHRNIVKIITVCSSVDFQGNEFKAIVFEFMANGSLEEWLHPKTDEQHDVRTLNFLQRLNIAIDVAAALDYLHNHCQPSIIHCDLKPTTVLLNTDMTALVADFGLAKIFSIISYNSSQRQCSSLAIRGSIGYVAPEYGMGGTVSMQGDVYSYGILLLEMFTGKRPTDEIFHDEQNLLSFSKKALLGQVMNFVDPSMLFENSEEAMDSNKGLRVQKCLVSTIKLGVACSAESPIERMNIGEVVNELNHIKEYCQVTQVNIE